MSGPIHQLARACGLACVILGTAFAASGPVLDAAAASYYVRSDGSDSNAGLSNSAAGAWRTIGKANSVLSAGDVVTVLSLNAADTSSSVNLIRSARAGTAQSPIVYVGDPVAPQNLPVSSIDLTQSYVVVRGFRSKGNLGISSSNSAGPTVGSVVEHCVIIGQMTLAGAQNCRVSNNGMWLKASSSNSGDQPHAVYFVSYTAGSTRFAQFDTLLNNTIDINPINAQARAFQLTSFTNNCVLQGNTINMTFDNRGVESAASGIAIHESYNNTYRGNTWNLEIATAVGSGTGRWYPMTTRSQTFGNLFENEAFLIDTQAPHFYSFFTLGQASAPCTSAPAIYDCNGGARNNTWRGCVFKSLNGEVLFYDGADGATIENCTFVNGSHQALAIQKGMKNCTLLHNTFYSATRQAFGVGGSLSGTNDVYGNIFYSAGSLSCSNSVEGWPARSGFSQDANLFYGTSGNSGWAVGDGSSCFAVGSGSAWNTTYGHDPNSIWANPMLANTSSVAAFDATPLAGSPAIAARFPNGYAGSVAVADATPPSAISNLTTTMLSDVNLRLSWTAPGDNGTSGTAAAYDLRRSSQPITDANFASATAVSGLGAPAPAGSQEGIDVTGLSPGTNYYFAIKARDRGNNWSPLSNVLLIATSATDVVAPASTSDFRPGP